MNLWGQIPEHTDVITHIIKKRTLAWYPKRPQRCLADGVDVVLSDDEEASPGEAGLSNILFGAFVLSAQQQDTDVGQGRSNAAHLLW